MRKCKKILCLVLALVTVSSLCACGNNSYQPQANQPQTTQPQATQPTTKTIKIPDVEKLDVTTAKTLLAGKGLIPKVEYEFNNDYDYDLVIRTEPAIGSQVEEDTPVTLYVCKGPVEYELPNAVGSIWNIDGIDNFVWWNDDPKGVGTKAFGDVIVRKGYLYITIRINCKSKYAIEWYGDFGTASINDSFDKTVPIEVIYTSKKINNNGADTVFTVKIPLSDLGVQKPTNIYIQYHVTVDGERKLGRADFDLTW